MKNKFLYLISLVFIFSCNQIEVEKKRSFSNSEILYSGLNWAAGLFKEDKEIEEFYSDEFFEIDFNKIKESPDGIIKLIRILSYKLKVYRKNIIHIIEKHIDPLEGSSAPYSHLPFSREEINEEREAFLSSERRFYNLFSDSIQVWHDLQQQANLERINRQLVDSIDFSKLSASQLLLRFYLIRNDFLQKMKNMEISLENIPRVLISAENLQKALNEENSQKIKEILGAPLEDLIHTILENEINELIEEIKIIKTHKPKMNNFSQKNIDFDGSIDFIEAYEVRNDDSNYKVFSDYKKVTLTSLLIQIINPSANI